MARSHYKGQWIGKLPMCAICAGPGEGERALHHLTHGVSVWLCAAHRSVEFQRRRAGRDFVASLAGVWRAAGIASKRYDRALSSHMRRVRPDPPRRARPGSYAWADLRRRAEARFRAGEDPARVIEDLRHAPISGASRPSYRTLRRWFAEGRWIRAVPPRHSHPAHEPPRPAEERPARQGTPPGNPPIRSGPIRGPC